MGQGRGATQVLIADDSPVILHMLEAMFRGTGFEVLTAHNGLEAVEMAFAHDVSLIILDVMMPRLSGYQACRLLKSEAQTKSIPVIILTSKDEASDRFWGLETGADYYLTKDEASQKLLELVAAALAEWKSRTPRHAVKRHSSIDILSRVNDLLDRQLFEATLLSEIGRVARHLVRFDETVLSVMELVGRVVDFTVGSIVFVDGDEFDGIIVLHRPAGEAALEAFRQRLAEAAQHHRAGAPLTAQRTRLLTLERADKEGFPEDDLQDFTAFPIVTGEQLVGLLGLAGRAVARMTPETEALMVQVTNQTHIVVENSRLVERLRDLSIHDGLTDLFNHRHIMETLANEFQRAGRYGKSVSVLMIDIDRFKLVNDTYGHQAGDAVLRELARLLVGTLRAVDAVGRYGGEEFMVVLPETGSDEARLTAERVRRLVAERAFSVAGHALDLTVSIGVANYPGPDVASVSDLIRLSDRALYHAKTHGRNRVAGLDDEQSAVSPSQAQPRTENRGQ
jgi:two-component system cell cycle response regulator